MSTIAVGFYLCQADPDHPHKHFYARFGFMALNDREQHFSQPKLELYRLFCALYALGLCTVTVQYGMDGPVVWLLYPCH